jgi:hypothetical protein
MGVFSLHKYKGSKGMGIRNVWKWKIHREQEDAHTSAVCKGRAMLIQLAGSIVVLVDAVILAQGATQGWDNISFLALVHLLLCSESGPHLGICSLWLPLLLPSFSILLSPLGHVVRNCRNSTIR